MSVGGWVGGFVQQHTSLHIGSLMVEASVATTNKLPLFLVFGKKHACTMSYKFVVKEVAGKEQPTTHERV